MTHSRVLFKKKKIEREKTKQTISTESGELCAFESCHIFTWKIHLIIHFKLSHWVVSQMQFFFRLIIFSKYLFQFKICFFEKKKNHVCTMLFLEFILFKMEKLKLKLFDLTIDVLKSVDMCLLPVDFIYSKTIAVLMKEHLKAK